MDTKMSLKVQFSNLLVICDEQSDFNKIAQLLIHYFPNHNNQSFLLISNKYYQAYVNLVFKTWNETYDFLLSNDDPSEQQHIFQEIHSTNPKQQSKNQKKVILGKQNSLKYDLMIMLVDQKPKSIINFESLDQIIEKINPEEFVLVIDTPNPQEPWIYEETILQKCNNFIQIVKEDLWNINKTKPNWARGALLNNQQEVNDTGIFSILDRIQTTRWTTMVNANKQQTEQNTRMNQKYLLSTQNGINTNQSKNLESSDFNSNSQQIIPTNFLISKKKLGQDNIEKSSLYQEETDEKKLEQEIKEFEIMMKQMMSFKIQSSSMKNEERKQKAEKIFSNIFKGMMTFE